MKASKVLSVLFILVGFVILGFGLGTHPQLKWLVLTGVVVSVFGALMYPSGGAGPAFQTVVIALGSLPIFGGRRVGDPPAVLPPPITPSTTEEKKP